MNISLMGLELGVLVLAIGVLLLDLWMPADRKRLLGYLGAVGVAVLLAYSFAKPAPVVQIEVAPATGTNTPAVQLTTAAGATNLVAFRAVTPNINGGFVSDGLATFFKRFFLVAALVVLVMS